jgi:hypothetical protein
MRVVAGDVGRDVNGDPILVTHPATGEQVSISSHECIAYLDGEPCHCRVADEEMGIVEAYVTWPDGKPVPCDVDEGEGIVTRYRTGKVEIKWELL